MMKNLLWAAGSVIASVVLAVLFLGHGTLFGTISSPATNLDYLQLSQGLQLPAGPSVSTSVQGTNVQGLFHGTCNAATSGSLAATSSVNATCTVAGVATGDQVFVKLPLAAGSPNQGLWTGGTSASTNTITFAILNGTGAATSSYSQATTSVQYWVVR